MSAPEPGVIPPLFAGLVDDAAVFPPGNLPLPEAVAAHRRHRAAWYADLVGPFLVGSGKIAELTELADPADPLRVAVVVAGGAEAVGPALTAVLAAPGLVLAGAETAGDTAAVIAAYHEFLPEDLSGAVEVAYDDDLEANLELIAATRHRAKFRTGGVVAEAFPSPEALGRFLWLCAARSLPFKLTAGLHNAMHHTDPETGFVHHGFLNVAEATLAARRQGPYLWEGGREIGEFAAILADESGRLADRIGRAAAPEAPYTRELFTGFGSCSIDEPLDDLVALGLVARPAAPARTKEQHP
ncbi:hypothetical protein [Yinghuangia soli]|uniref:Uncharacterized protein n=1 Tax=Yinghuangia soli TaxID=2908204 RepID=A0AA41PWI2_9ACTN|nr:hypothetical protein [Yinghuangia soli]MCF2526149.1 hypothetical protein [Yinghuangia soli]